MVLAGGSEAMSQAPYAVRNARWGTRLGQDLKVVQTYKTMCFFLAEKNEFVKRHLKICKNAQH